VLAGDTSQVGDELNVTAVWCITLISRAGETGSVSFDGRSGQSLHVW
jgi:hypothetical protein